MRRRVLLVEDDLDQRELFALILRQSAFEVVEASSVKEAVEAIRILSFDAMVSDFYLVDGTAGDLLAVVGDRRPTTIVMTSATERSALRGVGERTLYLRKPVDVATLIELLKTEFASS